MYFTFFTSLRVEPKELLHELPVQEGVAALDALSPTDVLVLHQVAAHTAQKEGGPGKDVLHTRIHPGPDNSTRKQPAERAVLVQLRAVEAVVTNNFISPAAAQVNPPLTRACLPY